MSESFQTVLGTQSSYERPRGQDEKEQPVASASNRKRPEVTSDQAEKSCKRRRGTVRKDMSAPTKVGTSKNEHPIAYWSEHGRWPPRFPENLQDLSPYGIAPSSIVSESAKARDTTPATPSDQRPREEMSAPYRHASYPVLLETLGDSYMDESRLGITDASRALHKDLLERECTTPEGTLFGDDVFDTACRNVRDKNEGRIIQDFARLLVPSPESLAAFGATDLDMLVESVNEGWNSSIPVTSPRPQPEFAVGFRRSMFSDVQLARMQPLLGDSSNLSYFKATHYMFFPFMTCEVKHGAVGLEVADRQNAHSMTIALRGIVELFKLGKREKELHRELLTFSISHDHRTVRLYGYYPVFDGPKTKIHRHQIHAFDITTLNGKDKWTAYKFTLAVYHYSLTLLEKIRSLVDDLPPDLALDLSQQSESQPSEPSGLSQALEEQVLADVPDPQQNRLDLRQMTPDTSMQGESASSKKRQKQNV